MHRAVLFLAALALCGLARAQDDPRPPPPPLCECVRDHVIFTEDFLYWNSVPALAEGGAEGFCKQEEVAYPALADDADFLEYCLQEYARLSELQAMIDRPLDPFRVAQHSCDGVDGCQPPPPPPEEPADGKRSIASSLSKFLGISDELEGDEPPPPPPDSDHPPPPHHGDKPPPPPDSDHPPPPPDSDHPPPPPQHDGDQQRCHDCRNRNTLFAVDAQFFISLGDGDKDTAVAAKSFCQQEMVLHPNWIGRDPHKFMDDCQHEYKVIVEAESPLDPFMFGDQWCTAHGACPRPPPPPPEEEVEVAARSARARSVRA